VQDGGTAGLIHPSAVSCKPAQPETGAVVRATKVRWRILAIVVLIMAVTALNRLNLSIGGKYIEEEFSFNTIMMGRIFSSFLWGYAIFQIPWGYICDRYGPHRTLTISILCFSLGSAAMGVAPRLAAVDGFSTLLAFQITRFLTGVGEAAISSNVMRAIASWMPRHERGFASGFQVAGLGLGGALTPIFIAWTTVHWGWRTAFYLSAGAALIVGVVWYFYASDWPEEHAGVNAQELELIHPGIRHGDQVRRISASKRHAPWSKIFSSPPVWGLIFGYACHSYAFYVYYHWFYFYAVKVRGLSILSAAVWTSLPFLAMALLSPLGGWFSDHLAGSRGRRRGRQYAVWLGMGLSAMLLVLGNHLTVTSKALVLIALAAGFNMFAATNFWASCIDLAPDFSASLSALMNTFGSVGGAISSTLTAYIAVQWGWSQSLDAAAVITVLSGLLFTFVDAERTIEEKSL